MGYIPLSYYMHGMQKVDKQLEMYKRLLDGREFILVNCVSILDMNLELIWKLNDWAKTTGQRYQYVHRFGAVPAAPASASSQ